MARKPRQAAAGAARLRARAPSPLNSPCHPPAPALSEVPARTRGSKERIACERSTARNCASTRAASSTPAQRIACCRTSSLWVWGKGRKRPPPLGVGGGQAVPSPSWRAHPGSAPACLSLSTEEELFIVFMSARQSLEVAAASPSYQIQGAPRARVRARQGRGVMLRCVSVCNTSDDWCC